MIARILCLFLLFPVLAYGQQLDSLQNYININKIDVAGKREGLWIDNRNNYRFYIRGYNKESRGDGVEIALKSTNGNGYNVESIYFFEDGMLKKAIDFYDNGKLHGTIDSVQPINAKMFPEIEADIERCKNSFFGQYGIVQYYHVWYNEDGETVKDEGWYCAYLDEDNYFDFQMDIFPIGIHRSFQDGKWVERDETSWSIQVLLNMAGLNDEEDGHKIPPLSW